MQAVIERRTSAGVYSMLLFLVCRTRGLNRWGALDARNKSTSGHDTVIETDLKI